MGGGGSLQRDPPDPLVGRDEDLDLIRSFVDQAAVRGGALLLTGDVGVGKTVVLDVAAAHATAAGTRVLRAAGAEFEADVSFAGLHQLLQPVFDGLDRLSPTLGRALSVALGQEDGSSSEQLVIANAALALLVQAAAVDPLVVIVDDLPWLDRASAVVLGFVARRLTGSRVGFLAASRFGEESFFERSGVPEHELRPLDDAAAAALLKNRFPVLAPRVRQRLVADAQGNPLALLELPAALSGPQRAASESLPAVLPLSRRLQSLFASRVNSVPGPTRRLLLLAALEGTGDLHILQSAAAGQHGIGDLAPAERAQLVHVDERTGRVAFRHPLIRSAVVELSTSDERQQVHTALAEQLVEQPERRAWHLADAAVEPDEQVAGLLEQLAHGIRRRGDAVAAIAALLRAAELSQDGSDRSRRLAEAAYFGADVTGDLRNVPQLLDDARRADPGRAGSLAAAVAASYHLLNGDGDVDTAHRLLVGAIEMQPEPYDADDDTLIEALHTLLLVCFFGGRPELWEPFETAVSRLTPRAPDVLAVLSRTFPDPARTALPAVGQLDAAIAGLRYEADPARIVRTGIAAAYVDRLPGCREALWRVVRDGRDGGAVTSAIDALFLLSNDAFLAGQWDDLVQLSDEGLRLCEAHSYRVLAWPGLFLQALLAAARGDDATTRALTDKMTAWAAPRRMGSCKGHRHRGSTTGSGSQGCMVIPAGPTGPGQQPPPEPIPTPPPGCVRRSCGRAGGPDTTEGDEVNHRRLVGIDLGIASAHTVRVLDGEGNTVAKRKAWPTVESLGEVEAAALAGCPESTRLEVVVEPTGPAWLPIAAFFSTRGHVVHRVSSAKAHDLRRFLSRHTKTNGIDADALARLPLFDPAGLQPLVLAGAERAALDRRVRVTDRLTQQGALHKRRIKDLARQLLPMTPLTGELGVADLAVLERYADPNALLRLGLKRLTTLIEKASKGHQGLDRARAWIAAAEASVELYAGHPAIAFADLAAEIATEVRLLLAVRAELAKHAAERETAYRWVDPGQLARSLPGVADIGGPALVAAMGDPARFAKGKQFRSFTGLVPKASETGDTDRKGQAMSKAGSSLLRTTLVRAADNARKTDPQLARIYYVQMVERGKDHLGALCVVAANLAERAWAVMNRGMPYVICNTDGRPVTPAEAKAIINEHWTVPAEVRARRRSKKSGKAPQTTRTGQHARGDLPRHGIVDQHHRHGQQQPQRRTA